MDASILRMPGAPVRPKRDDRGRHDFAPLDESSRAALVAALKEVGAHGKVYRVTDHNGRSPYADALVDRGYEGAKPVVLDLPRGKRPGAWTPMRPNEQGYYLTPHPQDHLALGMRVFEAEVDHTVGAPWVRVTRAPEGYPMVELRVSRFRLLRERPELVYPQWRAIEQLFRQLDRQRAWMHTGDPPLRRWLVLPTYRDAFEAHGRAAMSHIPMLSRLAEMERSIEQPRRRIGNREMTRMGTSSLEDQLLGRFTRMFPVFESHEVLDGVRRDYSLAIRLEAIKGMPIPDAMIRQLAPMQREIVARLEVWARGYGCFGFIDGTAIVYRRA